MAAAARPSLIPGRWQPLLPALAPPLAVRGRPFVGRCARGVTALSAVQRTRVVVPAFWRDFDFRRSESAPLCNDRLARAFTEALLPLEDRAALASAAEAELEADVAGAHTAFIDRMVLDALGRRLRQVVLLGSGMDSRAYRLDVPPQLKVLEVDEGPVLTAKEEVLVQAGERARCMLRRLEAPECFIEAAEVPTEALTAALDVRRPSLFVLEGLLDAWPRDLHTKALAAVAGLAGSGSRLLATVRGGPGASAEAKAALQAAGWTRVDIVGQAALARLFHRAPPDTAAQLMVAECGVTLSPGRPAPARTPVTNNQGGPVEVAV